MTLYRFGIWTRTERFRSCDNGLRHRRLGRKIFVPLLYDFSTDFGSPRYSFAWTSLTVGIEYALDCSTSFKKGIQLRFDDEVSVYVTDATEFVLDIDGYFVSSSGLDFFPLTPCRIADTMLPGR